jgi:inhibitor of KinA sporulation pathway (predicted exonuclease)
MKTTDKIIIIDLEATCWNGPQPKDEQSEIIEIGICVLDTKTGKIDQNRGILITPERSTISAFCTELTTITINMIDNDGISFTEACKQIVSDYNSFQYTWASYGAYDLKMMRSQCEIMGVDFPLSSNHENVKELFAEKKGLKKKVGMRGALHILDIPLEGTHHRGKDDAVNIAKILRWCLARS